MQGETPHLFHELSWPALDALVESGVRLCLLPVGATEQHGPHLPVSTDSDIATALCRAASERTGAPVLPTLWAGSSQAHTTAWPGTLSLPPRLLVEVVVELAGWVRASGFEKLLIVNAHVGNVGPLRVAVDEIRHGGDLRVGAVSWWQLTPEIEAHASADADDWHANAAETSLMLLLRPELVNLAAAAAADDPDRTEDLVFSYTVRETSRNGVTGKPSEATADAGARLFSEVVDALVERIRRGREESPPLSA